MIPQLALVLDMDAATARERIQRDGRESDRVEPATGVLWRGAPGLSAPCGGAAGPHDRAGRAAQTPEALEQRIWKPRGDPPPCPSKLTVPCSCWTVRGRTAALATPISSPGPKEARLEASARVLNLVAGQTLRELGDWKHQGVVIVAPESKSRRIKIETSARAGAHAEFEGRRWGRNSASSLTPSA